MYTWKLFHTWSGQCGKTSLWFRCFLRVKNSNLYSHKRYVFVIRNGSMLTPPMICTLYTVYIAVGVWRFYWTYVDTYSITKFRKYYYYWTSKPIALNPWGNYPEKIILQSITHLGRMIGPIIGTQIELSNFLLDFLVFAYCALYNACWVKLILLKSNSDMKSLTLTIQSVFHISAADA